MHPSSRIVNLPMLIATEGDGPVRLRSPLIITSGFIITLPERMILTGAQITAFFDILLPVSWKLY